MWIAFPFILVYQAFDIKILIRFFAIPSMLALSQQLDRRSVLEHCAVASIS